MKTAQICSICGQDKGHADHESDSSGGHVFSPKRYWGASDVELDHLNSILDRIELGPR